MKKVKCDFSNVCSRCNETEVKDVISAFNNFLSVYGKFRKDNGLDGKKIVNVHEMLTGMTDKHGRICRQVKHFERNDPKNDWPTGMTTAMTGYIIYSLMLLEHYGMDISDGMILELSEAIKQHSKKSEKSKTSKTRK